MIATSGVSAGTAASCSPVNGQMIGAHVRPACQVGAGVAAHHRERESRGAGRVPVRHPRVAVLVELDRSGPAVLDRVAEAVQRADARVAAVGEHELAGGAHPDHLVVEDVRRHPDQLELAPALAQQLVAGGERDQVGEALHRDRVAVGDERRQCVRECRDFSHARSPGRTIMLLLRAHSVYVVRYAYAAGSASRDPAEHAARRA